MLPSPSSGVRVAVAELEAGVDAASGTAAALLAARPALQHLPFSLKAKHVPAGKVGTSDAGHAGLLIVCVWLDWHLRSARSSCRWDCASDCRMCCCCGCRSRSSTAPACRTDGTLAAPSGASRCGQTPASTAALCMTMWRSGVLRGEDGTALRQSNWDCQVDVADASCLRQAFNDIVRPLLPGLRFAGLRTARSGLGV